MRVNCSRRCNHVQDVRELAAQHPGREHDVLKDGAVLDTLSVLEQAALTTTSSSVLTTLSRTALTLVYPSHATQEAEDTRNSCPQRCDETEPFDGLQFIPGKCGSRPEASVSLPLASQDTSSPPGSRPRLLNRLYLGHSIPDQAIPATATVLANSPGAAPSTGCKGGSTSSPAISLFDSIDGTNARIIRGGSAGRGSSAGAVHVRGGGCGGNASNGSGTCSRRKRLAPVNLRLASNTGLMQHAINSIGTCGVVASAGMATATRSACEVEDDRLLSDEVEQSVTIAADQNLLVDTLYRPMPSGESIGAEVEAPRRSTCEGCSGPHHGEVADVPPLTSAQGGVGGGVGCPKPPFTPKCVSMCKAATMGQMALAASTCLAAGPRLEMVSRDNFVSKPQAWNSTITASAAAATCRIRMKLHSSNPEDLRPSMLGPLARLLLPYRWALRDLAVRPGCLELVLDYTRLDAGVDAVPLECPSSASADTATHDRKVAELLSCLHRCGLWDPSIEPTVAVQVNQQMWRTEWQGHGDGANAVSRTELVLRGPVGDFPSWCTNYPALKLQAQMPVAEATAAEVTEQSVSHVGSNRRCWAEPACVYLGEAYLNMQPDVTPLCLAVPCTAAAMTILYVAVPRVGLHSCTARCMGRFLPVRELQRLSAATVRDAAVASTTIPAAFEAAHLAIDWDAAAVAGEAAGANGEVLIILIESLPRHCGLLQVELRMHGVSESWSSHMSTPRESRVHNEANTTRVEQEYTEGWPLGFAGMALETPPTPLQAVATAAAPPRPALYKNGVPEVISAAAPVLLLHGCACALGKRCDCAHARQSTTGQTSMADDATSGRARGKSAGMACSMLEATGVSTELAGLKLRIMGSHATAAAESAAAATSAPAAAEFSADHTRLDGAEASREFIYDLGLLLDAAACLWLAEEEEEAVKFHDYPSFSREVRSLLLRQLGLFSGDSVPIGNSSCGVDGDMKDVLLRQHLANTAVTLLAACVEFFMPYTARLVVSCAACKLQLCSEDMLREAVAAGDNEVASRLDSLLAITEYPFQQLSSEEPSRLYHDDNWSVGGTGDVTCGGALAPILEAPGTALGLLSPRALSGNQHGGITAAADALEAVLPTTVLDSISSTLTVPSDGGRAIAAPMRLPPRACHSEGALAQQHRCDGYYHLRHDQIRSWNGTELGRSLRPGPPAPSCQMLGVESPRLSSPCIGLVDLNRSMQVSLGRPEAGVQGLGQVLGQPNACTAVSIASSSLSTLTQPVRYQRFLKTAKVAKDDSVEALSGPLQAVQGERWGGLDTASADVLTNGCTITGSQSPRGERCAVVDGWAQGRGPDDIAGEKRTQLVMAAAMPVPIVPATPPMVVSPFMKLWHAAMLLREFGKQVMACFLGFPSPHLEQAFWRDTASRLQTMCRLYAIITLGFVSLSVARAFLQDGLAAAAFMSFYQGGQALLLAGFGVLGDGRPGRLFSAVVTCTVLRAVCHAMLSRGLAPLPSFVLPVCRTGADLFNEGVAKAMFEQVPARLFLVLMVFIELPAAFALYLFLDGYGQGLLASCLLCRLAIFSVLKTAVVMGTQAAWRVQFLAYRAVQAKCN